MNKKIEALLNPRTTMFLFDILIVATPFLMLQNYLQYTIKGVGDTDVFGIPLALIGVIIAVGILVYSTRKYITITRIIDLAFMLLLMALFQNRSDYYLDCRFYDIQNLWHYMAYFFLSLVIYRYCIHYNKSEKHRIYMTLYKAILISLFDEGIQVFISDRVFDLSDVAKDGCGAVLGLIFIFFVIKNTNFFKEVYNKKNCKFKDFFTDLTLIHVNFIVFVSVYVTISSILSDSQYWYIMFFITFIAYWATSLLVFLLFSRRKTLAIIIGCLVIAQTASIMINYNRGVYTISDGIVSVRGIIIPYFDFFVYSNGYIRLVDKKDNFFTSDVMTLSKHSGDILIVASGTEGEGGKGFTDDDTDENVRFIYNPFEEKPVQVAVLKNDEAFTEYNRLKNAGKNVSIVVYNN